MRPFSRLSLMYNDSDLREEKFQRGEDAATSKHCCPWQFALNAPSPLQARLAAPLTSHFPSGSLAFAWDICHNQNQRSAGKVKDFTKIYKFAPFVTIIEIAFVRLHIIIKSLVSLLATFPLPVTQVFYSNSNQRPFFKSPLKWSFPVLIKKFTTRLYFGR